MELDTILSTVKGWLDADEARMLHDCAACVDNGCIVEIGSYRGRSTLVLATPAKVPVYSIDPYLPSDNEQFGDVDREQWYWQIASGGVANRVRAVHLTSLQAQAVWQEPIGLLFIDGAHDALSVTLDFVTWQRHVVNGGLIALHDSDWTGVKATLTLIKDMAGFEFVRRADATTIVRVCR